MAEGTPEEVAESKGSHTGAALREILESLRDSVAAKEKKSKVAALAAKIPDVVPSPKKSAVAAPPVSAVGAKTSAHRSPPSKAKSAQKVPVKNATSKAATPKGTTPKGATPKGAVPKNKTPAKKAAAKKSR